MTLFRSQVHQDIWIEHHCDRCWRGANNIEGCTILERALRTERKPVEWDRNPHKNALMQDTIRCNAQAPRKPRIMRPVVNVDLPMFDVEPTINMDGDHA